MKIAINGFGRIGRLVLRSIIEKNLLKKLNVVAINDLGSLEMNCHLLKFDSTHGPFEQDLTVEQNNFFIGKHKIQVFAERDPKKLPWKQLGVDLVLECTGLMTKKELASQHLSAGAKRVLISAPGQNADKTVCFGINHETLNKNDLIISNASCTTNCLAPISWIINKEIGLNSGFMTTIHACTGDQKLLDTYHSSDMRRARSSFVSMIPTSTGAAKSIGLVIPELQGKLDGTAIRVPTTNVSLIDFTFTSSKSITPKDINALMVDYSKHKLKGILGVNHEPLVSIDFCKNSHSSIFDTTQTQVVGDKLYRILAWYDNEWGFSCRMCDVSLFLSNF